MDNNKTMQEAARYWDSIQEHNGHLKQHWWQKACVLRHVNNLVVGKPLEQRSAALVEVLKHDLGADRIFDNGVSVGCGAATKEIELLKMGLVEHFDCFEISEVFLASASANAIREGVEDRLTLIKGDALTVIDQTDKYDFIHWNDALHHMPDVCHAVEWSYRVCRNGGVFYMDDFVGPTRYQWTDDMLRIASSVRRCFRGSICGAGPTIGLRILVAV